MRSTLLNITLIAGCLAILTACQRAEAPVVNPRDVPIVPAKGKILSKDSIADPEVIPVDWSAVRTIVAGEPEVVPVSSNTKPLGHPVVVARLTEQICIPGQDSFIVPEVVAAVDSPYVIEIPKSVPAGDPVVRERNPYGFSALSRREGLSSDWVTGITQDRLGNMWLVTGLGGVCRYDGQSFTHFSYSGGVDFVLCVLEDRQGNLWFGRWGSTGGIDKFDGRQVSSFQREQGLIGRIAEDMIEDRHGNLWVATRSGGGGVSRYDGSTFTNFTQEQGLSSNTVRCLHEDKEGNIWIGTSRGINKYDGKVMYRYVAGDGQSDWAVNDIIEDRNGNLWIATSGHGILMFDGSSYIRYSSLTGTADVPVWDIHEDRSGQLWFGTEGKGIFMMNSQSVSQFSKDDGLFNDRILCIAEDRDGRIWFGTHGAGAMIYSGGIFKHFTEQNGLSDNDVTQVVQGGSGDLWIAMGHGGVNRFDGTSFTRYGIEQGLPDLNIWCILEDRHGNVWWGGDGGGIIHFDGTNFTHYSGAAGFPSVHFDLIEDASGDLWMGSWRHGVTRFDGQTLTSYQPDVLGSIVRVLFKDSKGNLWIVSERPYGLTRYDGERFTHFTADAGLVGNTITDVYEDPEGNLWIAGSGAGVSVYDGDSFIHLNENVGLSTGVYEILEDRQGNLWFTSGSSGEGISRLAAADRTEFMEKIRTNSLNESDVFITRYTYDDGFLGRNGFDMFEDRDGRIWVTTNDMLTVFHPEDAAGAVSDITAPSMQLTDIVLFNEQVDWHAIQQNRDTILVLGNGVQVKGVRFDGLSPWYGMPQELSLSHRNNHVSFSFVGVTAYQADQVQYQYILEGLDDNWSRISSHTSAPYGNLSHGHYVFKVKARGSTGAWSEEFHFPFVIRPPWWKTWWAYTIYGLIFIVLVWRIHLFQRARIARIEREKTRERELQQAKAIEKAYSELEQAHEHLKATQEQLVHSEKMASLGELTAGIAHEIKNPLNFVNNFSEVSHELLEEMKSEIAKGNSGNASGLADDVMANLQKILQHGQRADGIVQSMLQHSRGSTGVKELTDINQLADEYLRLAYHGLRAKDKSFNAGFELQTDPSLPRVKVVPQDIGRVLLNLFNNAFYAVNEKYKQMPEDYRPLVTVSTRFTDQVVKVTVADNGNGIPADVADKVFQPFFTTKPTGEGTGLGLSLAYDIITKGHEGRMHVESQPGVGTTFHIELPR